MSAENISEVLSTVVDELISQNTQLPSNTPRDLNEGYCNRIAAEVYERMDEPKGMELYVDAEYKHYWIEYEDSVYDAEKPNGVASWKDLPYWKRHTVPNSTICVPWARHTGI